MIHDDDDIKITPDPCPARGDHVTPDMLWQALVLWESFLADQRTIDEAGTFDNYEDAARARRRQARTLTTARLLVAKVKGKLP